MGLGPTHLSETSFTAVSSMQTSLLPSSLGHSATGRNCFCSCWGPRSGSSSLSSLGGAALLAHSGLGGGRVLGCMAHERPALPWSPHFGVSWQHPQPRLRSSCPWVLYDTWLFTALAEHLPLFPLCERRCHLPATSVFAIFAPWCWWPGPFNKMCLAPPASIGSREGGEWLDITLRLSPHLVPNSRPMFTLPGPA